jgi:hypothetical protein
MVANFAPLTNIVKSGFDANKSATMRDTEALLRAYDS